MTERGRFATSRGTKLRGLLFEAGVEIPAVEGLHHVGERRAQASVLLASEEIACAESGAQALHDSPSLLVRHRCDRPGRDLASSDALMVVVVEQAKGVGVVGHDAQHGGGLVPREGAPLGYVCHETHGLAEILEAALVDGIALEQVIAEHARGPDAELRATLGVDAVAYGEDGVEAEVADLVGLPIRPSCCKTCNNCLPVQLAGLEHVTQVPRDHGLVAAEQARHLVEVQPDGVRIEPNFKRGGAVRC